jgi:hypothetical protein
VKIIIECPSCWGTGLYSGFAEPKGVAVVCHDCEGTGGQNFVYKEFTGRRKRRDIERVSVSRTKSILACGPITKEISYRDWLEGTKP